MRRWGGYIFIAAATAVVLASLLLLVRVTANSAQFADLGKWVVVGNTVLVLAMAVLLARRALRLARDYRRHVPGSRLTVRTVAVFSGL
ncbi:MAG TPA: hypothetical protein VMH77_04245, partial [Steroidobacteraceae bacterium]|nr:hypothetical protein [Steroidobacteraceae bacterium]